MVLQRSEQMVKAVGGCGGGGLGFCVFWRTSRHYCHVPEQSSAASAGGRACIPQNKRTLDMDAGSDPLVSAWVTVTTC